MNLKCIIMFCIVTTSISVNAQNFNHAIKMELNQLINKKNSVKGIVYDPGYSDSLRIVGDVVFTEEQQKILNDPKYQDCIKELIMIGNNAKIKAKDLEFVKNQNNLVSFRIDGVSIIDSSILDYLVNKKMIRLDLHNIKLNAIDLKKIEKFYSLKTLILYDNDLDNLNLNFIANLKNMNILQMEKNGVTDDFMGYLSGIDLESLVLNHNEKITISAIKQRLSQLQTLGSNENKTRGIWVVNTKVTQNEVQKLKYDYLNLKIYVNQDDFEDPN